MARYVVLDDNNIVTNTILMEPDAHCTDSNCDGSCSLVHLHAVQSDTLEQGDKWETSEQSEISVLKAKLAVLEADKPVVTEVDIS